MAEFIPVPPFDLVVFGATGDLSLRKLFPALLHRFFDGQIPANSRIIGAARTEMDSDAFRKMVRESHAKFAPGICVDEAKCDAFMRHVEYVQLDATAPGDAWEGMQAALKDGKDKVRIFYLATAPSLFVPIAQRLAEGPPVALGMIKHQLEAAWTAPLVDLLETEAANQGKAFATADLREGAAAFVEKRSPRFAGR